MSTQPTWHIEHVDVCRPLPVLHCPSAAGGLYAVFWLDGVPMGDAYLPNERFPLTPSQVREIALGAIAPAVASYSTEPERGGRAGDDRVPDFLATTRSDPLRTHPDLNPRSEKPLPSREVSVVVCTRERPEALRCCLTALMRLSPAPFEILVVDNAPSTDATRRVVAAFDGVRYVCESRLGLDIARNTGLHHTTGEIVAYTDDDVEVHTHWVRQLAAAFRGPEVMGVTGLTFPAHLDTEAQVLFEYYWSFNRGYQPVIFDAAFFAEHCRRGVPVWTIGAGANMAFRRKVFGQVGDFDERLDVGAAGCSGDSEMWYRVLAAGYTCRYEPSAVVFHHHRHALAALKRQLFYYMRGHVAALLVQYERHGHPGNLRRLASLPRYYAGLLMQGMRAGFRGRYRTLFQEIGGAISGLGFYLRCRQPRQRPIPARRSPSVDLVPHQEAVQPLR